MTMPAPSSQPGRSLGPPILPTIAAITPAPAGEQLSEEAPDEWLLARIAERDLSALDLLYRRYSRMTFGVAYHILCSAEAAEDVVQDAFLTVWRRAETYAADRGSARTWLLSVVRNRAIDLTRRGAGRPVGAPLEAVFELAAPDVDTSAEALARIEAARVRAALDCLPRLQREVVELAFFSGLSYPEIAVRVGIPLGTVKSRIRLALNRLRTVLIDQPGAGLALAG